MGDGDTSGLALPRISRRALLTGAAVGGGLLVAWQWLPRDYGAVIPPNDQQQAFGTWLKIGRDGIVTLAMPACEMGQGISTLLAQIAAQELGADWRQMALELVPASPAFANPVLAARWASLWRSAMLAGGSTADDVLVTRFAQDRSFAVTADGTALAAYVDGVRRNAAAARCLLAQAAAARWQQAWESLEVRDGLVRMQGKSLRFADLVDEAATFDVPDPVPLLAEPASDGLAEDAGSARTRFPRLDLPAKVDGSLNFAADIRLPDMVFAAVSQGPVGDTRLVGFNRAAAAKVTGVIDVVRHPRWLAVLASNNWAAEKALRAMKPRFKPAGRLADSLTMSKALDQALGRNEGYRLLEAGDIGPPFEQAGKAAMAADYSIAAAPHGSIETSAATARFKDGRLELWMASQSPQAARDSAARALGIDPASVVHYPVMAGGSFDRRLDNEAAAQAALLARAAGRPVQVVWSRLEEQLRDPVRSPAHLRLAAVVTKSGQISAWSARIAAPPSGVEFGHRLLDGMPAHEALAEAGDKADPMMVDGAWPIYAIPNVAVDHHPAVIGLPTGRLRGNAAAIHAFAIESFIDELASRNDREPLSYRMAMLGHDPRLAACLTEVAALAGWDGGLDNSGQGLACFAMQGGRIAVIATARRDEGGVRVDRLSACVDIGRIVNRDIARQQIEGGLIFGLSLAMGCATGYDRGLADVRTLGGLNLPRMADTPRIDIRFMPSQERAADPGELAVAAVAPAIANALHSATGVRFRHLPLLGEG